MNTKIEPGFAINRALSSSPFLSGLGHLRVDPDLSPEDQLRQAAGLMVAVQKRLEELSSKYHALESDLRHKTAVLEGARVFFKEIAIDKP